MPSCPTIDRRCALAALGGQVRDPIKDFVPIVNAARFELAVNFQAND